MLILNRKGIADEELARRSRERSRKRNREDDIADILVTKRTRSASSESSLSVSTISTTASGPPSRERDHNVDARASNQPHLRSQSERRKRTRGSDSSAESELYDEEHGREYSMRDSNTRRKIRETSPHQRGRRRARSRSWSRSQSPRATAESPFYDDLARAPLSTSIEERSFGHGSRNKDVDNRDDHMYENTGSRSSEVNGQIVSRKHLSGNLKGPQAGVPPRERSLSPFSKRLALTQAMNTGQ